MGLRIDVGIGFYKAELSFGTFVEQYLNHIRHRTNFCVLPCGTCYPWHNNPKCRHRIESRNYTSVHKPVLTIRAEGCVRWNVLAVNTFRPFGRDFNLRKFLRRKWK